MDTQRKDRGATTKATTPQHVYPHHGVLCAVEGCPGYYAADRIAALEAEGMSHGDAAAVAMAEDLADEMAQDALLNHDARNLTGAYAADPLEQLAARFERNAADWRQVRGQPDLNDTKGAGYAAGMAEAYMLAAADIRAALRGDDPPGWDGAGSRSWTRRRRMAEYDPAAYQSWLEDMEERYAADIAHQEGECGEDCPVCRYEDSLEARADEERYEARYGS